MENLKKVNEALDELNAKLSILSKSVKKTNQLYEDCLELVKRRMEVSGE